MLERNSIGFKVKVHVEIIEQFELLVLFLSDFTPQKGSHGKMEVQGSLDCSCNSLLKESMVVSQLLQVTEEGGEIVKVDHIWAWLGTSRWYGLWKIASITNWHHNEILVSDGGIEFTLHSCFKGIKIFTLICGNREKRGQLLVNQSLIVSGINDVLIATFENRLVETRAEGFSSESVAENEFSGYLVFSEDLFFESNNFGSARFWVIEQWEVEKVFNFAI